MADLQDHYEPWTKREGRIQVGHVPMMHAQKSVTPSLFTMGRAVDQFNRVVEHFGDRTGIDPEGGGTRRRLYVRDADYADPLLPVPLVEHAWIAGIGQMTLGTFVNSGAVHPEDAPQDWKPRDAPWWPQDAELDILPQNANMQGRSLKLAEGTGYIEIEYDARGVRARAYWSSGSDNFWYARAFNTRLRVIDTLARPPTRMPFSLACRPELDVNGHSIDQMVEWVIDRRPERLLPHRVIIPLQTPGGVDGDWRRAQWALGEAAFDGRLPNHAEGWVVADAFEWKALAVGPDFPGAVARWREEVARLRPRPPKPENASERKDVPPGQERQFVKHDEKKVAFVSTGTIRVESPALADVAWPIPVPHHVPAAAVPLALLPCIPDTFRQAGFVRVLRMFGEHGAVTHGVVGDEADGFTHAGEGMLDVVAPATVGEEIYAAMAAQREWYADMPESFPNPIKEKLRSETHIFKGWDDARRGREPLRHVDGSRGEWTARNVKGTSGCGCGGEIYRAAFANRRSRKLIGGSHARS